MRERARWLIFVMVAGCGPDEDVAAPPGPIGPQVYHVSGGFCEGGCPELRLYRNGTSLQLLIFDADGTFVQETLATLGDAPAMVIDDASAELLAGQRDLGMLDSACLAFTDKAQVELSLLGAMNLVTFSFPYMCAPTGLADIDAQYEAALTAMMDCESGAAVSLDDGCVPADSP